MYSNHLKSKFSLNIKGKLYPIDRPLLMGILNVTPDSFYDGGETETIENAVIRTAKMLEDGANMIDIGAMSSRPYSSELPLEMELGRIQKIIPELITSFPQAIFSVDTYRSEVAEFALKHGVHIVNDITAGCKDDRMIDVVADFSCPYIAMHMNGHPKEMQINPKYENILLEIGYFFSKRMEFFVKRGLTDIILDVGFGFGKTIEDNYQLLKNLNYFQNFNMPILVGISRKSMIYKVLESSPEAAMNGTTALHWESLRQGAHILRVHDVKEAKEVCTLFNVYNNVTASI